MNRNWLAVASAEHVRHGRQLGIMQVCHGQLAPLRRLKSGDYITYYSPTITFRGKDKIQSFTALGRVKYGEPYQVVMTAGFCPYRLDVDWFPTQEASIIPLLNTLELTKGRMNWGYPLRFGLVPLSEHDMRIIAQAMNRSFA
ncbi:EVE domain-containing protein [Legionella fallonii]|uniref:UPF0310 protein LFA_2565 n=1 Tax=Legionella fallonii LLAP-10 TaxID=1212491 RepID=A0A098G7F5_9GAMM|nr:EVE domain-containing protein [Legionella fallonii]CEG57936.1 conserved protein of unknown function [Legionella fallonii LLAP-10]